MTSAAPAVKIAKMSGSRSPAAAAESVLAGAVGWLAPTEAEAEEEGVIVMALATTLNKFTTSSASSSTSLATREKTAAAGAGRCWCLRAPASSSLFRATDGVLLPTWRWGGRARSGQIWSTIL